MEKLFKNCLSIKEENGWFTAVRFTEKQRQVFSKSEYYLTRCDASSSACLRFRSKAKSVKIEYEITGKARDWAIFDVVKNGVLFSHVEVTKDCGVVELTLSGDENAITEIYLPQLVVIKIKAPITAEPLIPIEEDKKLWLALGDSITQGMVATHPSMTYPVIVATNLNYDLINCGIGGLSFNAEELDYIGKEPHLITIALGCNDWDHFTLDEIEKNVTKYLEKLCSLYKCRNVYGILPTWRSDELQIKNGGNFRTCRQRIKSVYQKFNFIKIIDGYELVPNDKKFFNDPIELQCHPSNEGFLYYATTLTRALNK